MRLELSSFDAAAFDFDGVLANTNSAHLKARILACEELGVTGITYEQHLMGHRLGTDPSTIIGGVLKLAKLIPPDADPYTDPLTQEIVQAKHANYLKLAQEGIEPIPGSIDFFERVYEAKRLGRLSIVSTARLEEVDPFIEGQHLNGFLRDDLVITHETITALELSPKPHPAPYVHAARSMHTRVSRVLVLEDSTGGVESGVRAGCLTLAMGTSHPRDIMCSPDLSYPPDMFAPSFADIELAD